MTDTITAGRLSLLQLIAKHPDVEKARLLTIKGIGDADLGYLVNHDLIREHEVGKFRVTHMGQMVIKRGL